MSNFIAKNFKKSVHIIHNEQGSVLYMKII